MKLRTILIVWILGQGLYSLCAQRPFFDMNRWVFSLFVLLFFWGMTQPPHHHPED